MGRLTTPRSQSADSNIYKTACLIRLKGRYSLFLFSRSEHPPSRSRSRNIKNPCIRYDRRSLDVDSAGLFHLTSSIVQKKNESHSIAPSAVPEAKTINASPKVLLDPPEFRSTQCALAVHWPSVPTSFSPLVIISNNCDSTTFQQLSNIHQSYHHFQLRYGKMSRDNSLLVVWCDCLRRTCRHRPGKRLFILWSRRIE